MLRRTSLLVLVLCLVGPAAAQAVDEMLPAGTLLQCTMDEPNFSSHTAEVGDPILCHASTIAAFGHSVFPRGAYLAGHFQEYRDPGRLFGKGWIKLEFDRLVLPGAVVLPLSAKVISVPHLRVDREGEIHGRGHPKRDALGWAIPILWPVKIITLPARGPRPALKGEARITLRLLEDVEISTSVGPRASAGVATCSQFRPSSTGMPSPQQWRDDISMNAAVNALSTASFAHTPEQEQVLRLTSFADHPSIKPVTLLILKDHTGYLASDYWLEAGELHYLTLDGKYKLLPLARLDLEETVTINGQRNVEFVLQSREQWPALALEH